MTHEIITFGCRLNTYESEVIKQAVEQAGTHNVIIFNTCAVTKEAERQAKQAIRRARKENPDKQIIVTGCAAQIHPESFASMKEVDKVLGNEEKLKAESYQKPSSFVLNEEKILVNDIMSITETASHLISGLEGRARAFVQVQNGCNHRCTFCIIPFGRGNSRSVPVGEIVTQVRKLVEGGYKEVVLTGVDISDYGKDLPGAPTLGQMVKRLLALIPELPRLRLSSIDVAEIDADLFQLIAEEPRFMPHLHLSVQAGDDMILKRMKRRHLREDVIRFCEKVRQVRPSIAFGADMIAGFPTETDAMFENSLRLIGEAGLHFLHVFPYSEREETPAARMPQVPVPIRKERAARLREEGAKQLQKLMQDMEGEKVQGLVEEEGIARTEYFTTIEVPPSFIPGTLLSMIVTGSNAKNHIGQISHENM